MRLVSEMPGHFNSNGAKIISADVTLKLCLLSQGKFFNVNKMPVVSEMPGPVLAIPTEYFMKYNTYNNWK